MKKLLYTFFSKKIIVPLVALFVVVASGLGIFYFSQTGGGLNLDFSRNDTEEPVAEAERIVREVGEIYLLPDEIPTLATVSDRNQLADQVFFQNAENGDKVLIYRTAGIAVLYRPSIKKIVNVGPVTLEDGEIESTTEITEALEEVSVLILNGTQTVGLTATAAEELSDLEYVTISERADADNKTYEETLIVYLNEAVRPQADSISQIISGQVVDELPEDEAETDADIVIILGNDFVEEEE